MICGLDCTSMKQAIVGLLRRVKRRIDETGFRFSKNPFLIDRYKLPTLLNARNLTGDGVEIGVLEGWYSHYLLTWWRGRKLISIDPWLHWDDPAYCDDNNRSAAEMERVYQECRTRLAVHGKRSEIWRSTGEDAAPRIPDGSLDFVYIDAQHQEEAVARDLAIWYPKLKPGGMFAGHDYMDGTFSLGVFGVKSAVDKFVRTKGISVRKTGETDCPTWYFYKRTNPC